MNRDKAVKFGIIMELIVLLLIGASHLEINFGRCLNNAGDGKLYNGEPFYNYICYNNIAKENDIVMTLALNDNDGDWLERWDWVVFKNIK